LPPPICAKAAVVNAMVNSADRAIRLCMVSPVSNYALAKG
jgi:hypothetical protein